MLDNWIYVSMEHWWNDCDNGGKKGLWEKSIPVSLCPPQISHSPRQDQHCATVVRSWRLTTCTITQSKLFWGNHCDGYIFNLLKNVVLSRTRPEHEVHWQYSCPCKCLEANWESGVTVPLILYIGSGWRWVVSLTAWPL